MQPVFCVYIAHPEDADAVLVPPNSYYILHFKQQRLTSSTVPCYPDESLRTFGVNQHSYSEENEDMQAPLIIITR